nr:MAG TPA: hypothetical protein [Caudoviricetes sp.]
MQNILFRYLLSSYKASSLQPLALSWVLTSEDIYTFSRTAATLPLLNM